MAQEKLQPLFAEERKHQILHILDENSKILISELCDTFHVSAVTIRNDLRELESDGLLKRTHGGAIPVGKASFEPSPSIKEVERIDEKSRIAEYAVKLVEDGDTIALDTGSTTMEFAKRLTGKRNLTVVTNDVQIAACLEEKSDDIQIVLIGGSLRKGFHCTVGRLAVDALADLNVDKAFMATNAFSIERGFTTPSDQQAEIKKCFLKIASQVIMLVDSSKMGKISFVKFTDLQLIDKLITDSGLSPRIETEIREAADNIDLILV